MQISQECGQISRYFLCISLSQKVKISLQMTKFPGNDIPKFFIFLSYEPDFWEVMQLMGQAYTCKLYLLHLSH